jgi:hypothetical protein
VGLQAPQLVFAAYHILLMALFFGSTGSNAVDRFERLLALIGVVVIAVQLMTGLGYFGTFIEETYLLALLWLLFIASFNFALVVLRRSAAS